MACINRIMELHYNLIHFVTYGWYLATVNILSFVNCEHISRVGNLQGVQFPLVYTALRPNGLDAQVIWCAYLLRSLSKESIESIFS